LLNVDVFHELDELRPGDLFILVLVELAEVGMVFLWQVLLRVHFFEFQIEVIFDDFIIVGL